MRASLLRNGLALSLSLSLPIGLQSSCVYVYLRRERNRAFFVQLSSARSRQDQSGRSDRPVRMRRPEVDLRPDINRSLWFALVRLSDGKRSVGVKDR